MLVVPKYQQLLICIKLRNLLKDRFEFSTNECKSIQDAWRTAISIESF